MLKLRIDSNNTNYNLKGSQNTEAPSENQEEFVNAVSTSKNNSQQTSSRSATFAAVSYSVINLTSTQQSALIKELLRLPDDLKDLLALLAFNESSPETVVKLLEQQNLQILLKDIQELLSKNSKEAVTKLLKLLQSINNQDNDQLNKLMSLLTQSVPAANSSSAEILTKTLILYLPWLPLAQQQDISLKFEERDRKEEGKHDERPALVMYISTINLGRFKVTITSDKSSNLNIDIESEKEERSGQYLEQIINGINQELKNNKTAGKTNVYPYKTPTEKLPVKKEISIYPVANISSKVMLAAYSIAKIIFEIDEAIDPL